MENDKYKEAVELSLKFWLWLFHNPGKGKQDSPYWDEVKDLMGNCPLCNYHFSNWDRCPKCVLYIKNKCQNSLREKKCFHPMAFYQRKAILRCNRLIPGNPCPE